MKTELYLIEEKNNAAKSSYAIISKQDIVEGKLMGQVIILEGEGAPKTISIDETFFQDDTEVQRIESKLTRELGYDVTIELVDCNLIIFLKEKFKSLIERIMKLTIDIELKKELEKILLN